MAREKKSVNEVIVEIANRLAVKRNGEEVVSDDFQGFWECFWNSLQHDRLSFAEALERATEKHAVVSLWARSDRWIFYVKTGINPFNSVPLNHLIDSSVNMALVNRDTGYDEYMRGWERCWAELRSGASPADAIYRAIDPDTAPDYERAQMAIRHFIREYRMLDAAAERG